MALLKNSLSLGVMQVANYIFPLLTVPYLARVLGVENFGLLGFATAIMTYLSLLTDYGFNVSATRRVAACRDNKALCGDIFSSVMLTKILLLFVGFLVLLVAALFLEKLNQHFWLYMLSFGVVVGQALFPLWYFMGMEKMGYIPMINVVSKSMFVISIFVFVHSEADILWVPLLASLEAILAGIMALFLVTQKMNVHFTMPSPSQVKAQFIEGKHIFLSSLAINTYKTNAVILLGLFSSNLIVGYFVIAKKIYDALGGINGVIHQVYLPHISRVQNGKPKPTEALKNLFWVSCISSSLLLTVTLGFAEDMIFFIAGEPLPLAIQSLHFFAFALFFVGINIPAAIYLLQGHHDKFYMRAIMMGALFDITMLLVLIPLMGMHGALITVVSTEGLITVLLYLYAYKVYRHG